MTIDIEHVSDTQERTGNSCHTEVTHAVDAVIVETEVADKLNKALTCRRCEDRDTLHVIKSRLVTDIRRIDLRSLEAVLVLRFRSIHQLLDLIVVGAVEIPSGEALVGSDEADRRESGSDQFRGKHTEQKDLLEHRTLLLFSDHTHDRRVQDQENEGDTDLKISFLAFTDLFIQDQVGNQAEAWSHQLGLGKRTEIPQDFIAHYDHQE